jgi:RHS repeat-associated protein
MAFRRLAVRRTQTEDPLGNLSTVVYGAAVTYTYLPGALRRTLVDPDGGTTTYSYDAASRMTSVESPWSEITTQEYDALGRATTITRANGTTTTATFDAAGRQTGIRHAKGGTELQRFAYSYDDASRRTGVTEANGDVVTWTLDGAGRLTREQRSGANAYDITYTMDGVGNRLTKETGGVTTTYTLDAADQLTSTNEGGTLATYTYDENGSPLTEDAAGSITTYTWNDANRLATQEFPGGEVSTMVYDAKGLRASREVGATTTEFVWDGQKVLAERESGATSAQYISSPLSRDAGGQYGNLVSQRRSGSSQWFLFDALGSTDRLTDSTGDTTDNYTYEAYGEVVASTGTTENPYRYVGKLGYYDNGDGSLYVRARHYQPTTARWLSVDPIPTEPRYVYVGTRPTHWADPSGQKMPPGLTCPPGKGGVRARPVASCRPRSCDPTDSWERTCWFGKPWLIRSWNLTYLGRHRSLNRASGQYEWYDRYEVTAEYWALMQGYKETCDCGQPDKELVDTQVISVTTSFTFEYQASDGQPPEPMPRPLPACHDVLDMWARPGQGDAGLYGACLECCGAYLTPYILPDRDQKLTECAAACEGGPQSLLDWLEQYDPTKRAFYERWLMEWVWEKFGPMKDVMDVCEELGEWSKDMEYLQ